MHTCPLEGPGCQGPAGRWRVPAAAAGEELLPRLPSPAPSPSPAPEAAGSRTAGPPELGPHLGKGQEAVSMSPPSPARAPPPPPHTPGERLLRGFSLPLTLHLSNRTAPSKQLQAWKRSQRGGDGGKRIKGLLLAGQARNLAELSSCCLSQPPQRQGVPWSTRGEIWSSAEERGNHRRRRMRDDRAQPRVTVGLQRRQRNCEGAPGEKWGTQRTVILRTQKRSGVTAEG